MTNQAHVTCDAGAFDDKNLTMILKERKRQNRTKKNSFEIIYLPTFLPIFANVLYFVEESWLETIFLTLFT